jgi:hypothetical protein
MWVSAGTTLMLLLFAAHAHAAACPDYAAARAGRERTGWHDCASRRAADPSDDRATDIARVIKTRAAAYRRCYEAALAKQPTLSGTFNYRIEVDDDGKVTRVGDIPDGDVEAVRHVHRRADEAARRLRREVNARPRRSCSSELIRQFCGRLREDTARGATRDAHASS